MKNLDKVCIDRIDEYDVEKIKAVLLKQFASLGGVEKILEKGKNVVVKPNLVIRKNPDAAATVNPAVVEAVCSIFTDAGADVVIAESSGGLYNQAVMNMTYKTCGLAKAAENSGAKLHDDFSEITLYREENELCRAFSVIAPIAKADVIIDLCKLKTHTIATMSGAVKNLFGVIPGIQKVEMHSRFSEVKDFCNMLVDLALTVKPTLSVMDAVDAMEGNGPTAGKKTHFGAILSSFSPFALDVVAAEIAKIPFEKVYTLTEAERRGIMKADIEEVEVIGELVEKQLKLPDTADTVLTSLSTIFGGRLRKYLEPKPVINKKLCRGCGECVKNCPMKLITLKDGKPQINRDGCIHCFCCHELCRFHAVDIKKPFVAKI